MSKRENHPKQVIIRHKDSVEVWEKNSAGNTTKEGSSRYNHKTGNTIDYYGSIISRGGREGNKKS